MLEHEDPAQFIAGAHVSHGPEQEDEREPSIEVAEPQEVGTPAAAKSSPVKKASCCKAGCTEILVEGHQDGIVPETKAAQLELVNECIYTTFDLAQSMIGNSQMRKMREDLPGTSPTFVENMTTQV